MQRTIELRSATIEQASASITMVRIREEVKLTTAIIAEVIQQCHKHMTGSSVVAVIPAFTDYDSAVMVVDHAALHGLTDCITALVIVCQEYGLLHLIRLYFAYYPPLFEVKFCDTLTEAGTWIAAQDVDRTAA